jgi:hypothetical protein
MSSERIPARSDCSATLADLFADHTEANVARAKTRVPPAVASEETTTPFGTAQ